MNREKNKLSMGMCFACAFISVMAFALTGFVYFSFFDKPYLSYKNLPFPPQLQHVKAGEVIPVRVVRCNSDRVTHNYTTTHSAWDMDRKKPFLLAEVRVPIEPGCTDAVSLVNRLPPDLPPGRYYVYGTAEVPGILRTHFVEWKSQPFEVVQ